VAVTHRAPARPLILALIAAMAIAVLPTGVAKPVLAAGTISLTALDVAYTQDFDTLASSGTSSTVPLGWDFSEAGTNANTSYTAGTGSSATGDTYSFGLSLAADRAFGGLLSGSLTPIVGASFTNDTGSTIGSAAITYNGEQWRLGAVAREDRLDFQYSTDATSLTTGTWTNLDTLDFVAPTTAGTLGAIDGNAAANRTAKSASIGGLSLASGSTIWVRWTDFNPAGSDDGLAIDDFTLTPAAAPPGDEAPSVATVTPANGATDVPTNAPIRITFSEPVTLDAEAAILSCKEATLAPTDDPKVFEFVYIPPLPAGGTCSYTIDADKVHDGDTDDPPDTMATNVTVSFTVASTVVISTDVKISQIYGGGGNSGATYRNDFIELFNRSEMDVSVAGWSVQYASAAGTTWAVTPLNGSVPAGKHYLIQEAAGAGGTLPLPDPDATGTIAMSATAGKVALVASTTALTGACPTGAAIVDFVGYGTTASCFEGTGPTPQLSNTTAALRDDDGATDTDDNAADFTVGAPNPRAAHDSAPRVASTFPASGATGVPTWANLTINFSEPVDVTGSWFSIGCATSGSHPATVSGGPGSFTLDPTTNFAGGESCTVTIVAPNVTDQDADDPPDAMAANHVFSFTVAPDITCGDPATFIHQVQGSGLASPLVNQTVEIEGVVVGAYPGANRFQGLHVQEEDADQDTDPATSEGIFIFEPNGGATYAVGDLVRIKGRVTEFNTSGVTLTELTNLNNLVVCEGGQTVTPAGVSLPFSSLPFAERFEGMLVDIDQELTVTETFTLGRFGEVVLSSGGRLITPTNIVAPGAPAIAQQAANDRNRIVLDDGDNRQNIDPTLYPTGGLSAENTLRIGDTTDGGTFVLEQRFGTYRLQPTVTLPTFLPTNPRPETPDAVGGSLRVASMNVLNYFTTLDTNPGSGNGPDICGPSENLECRGANTEFELDRQRAKILSALIGLDADVVGLMEIENNDTAAVGDLVDGLNEILGEGTYDFIDTGTIGTDAIKVAFIYQPAAATPVGAFAILDSSVDSRFIDTLNRPALAQTFESTATGGQATIIVNHLKSKGSACDGDPDLLDGQGNCNQTRVAAAEAMVDWIAGDPTGSGDRDALVIGDLNSYAMEDPIVVFEDAGYENTIRSFLGDDAYSFVFQGQSGYLDHSLAGATLPAQITGTTEWHINADEPIVLDYNTDFKSEGHVETLFAPHAYRSSDHDPVLVGADLLAYDFGGFEPPASAAGVTTIKAGQTLPVRFSLGGDRGPAVLDGDPMFQRTDCTSGAEIGSATTALAGEPFSYAPATDTYKFVWKTQKSWATWCGTLTVALADGTSEELDVQFTR
jgi:predicted extracellular nuclease